MKYAKIAKKVEDLLIKSNVQIERLSEPEIVALIHRWMSVYAPKEKKGKTARVFQKGQCFWSIFRSIEDFVEGSDAIKCYLKQYPAEYYVFGTNPYFGFRCKGSYVDFFHDDIYVCHHNLKWTIFFTHEMDFGLGPYFSALAPSKELKRKFGEHALLRKSSH